MKNLKTKKTIICMLFVAVICAVALVGLNLEGKNVIEASALKENYDYGEFTFLREMKLSSGQTAYYYESGNEYYSYAHDGDGNLLVKDEDRGTLEYAVSDGGKPVSSGVSYASSEKEIARVAKMQIGEMDLGSIDSQGLDGMTVIDTAPVLSSGTNYVSIVNLTIFISFKGETFTPDQNLINMFNGQSNSLKDYYQSMSNDRVNINSQIAYNVDNTVYVYQDSERRDYYNTNGSSRWTRESTLITNAIKGARERFNLGSGVNLDVNNDGYIDSISVIVHGKSSSTWGSLLWPHSVSLDAVDGENNYTLVNNVKVGKYSFNFSDGVTLGVLAHETAHNLGAPDLYHYGATTQNQDIVTVGKWDLMEMDLDTPQYLLAYMRKNYIGGIADSQIGAINENGVYSLKPVTETSESDVIAYKIPTSKDEYFMVEYRKAGESGYDSMLPGSGLIIYRVKEPEDFSTSRGNMDAVYKGTGKRADEVYVFRPAIQMTGLETFVSDRYNHSRYDIDRAYLSPSNPDFSKVGKEKSLGLYDFETIYYSDGTNSDIVIEALSMNGDSIEFSVKLGKDMVEDDYFDNRIKIVSAEVANTTDFAGVVAEIKFDTLNPRYLSNLQVELQDASGNKIVSNTMNLGRFLAEYNGGMRSANCNFIFASKGNEYTGGMFNYGSFISDNEPKKAVLKIEDADGDEKVICEIAVTDSAGFGWDTIVNSKTELKASIVASTRMTVGVKRDGTVDASGGDVHTSGQWAVEGISGVTSVALGYTHTLLLTESLNVIAVGDDNYSETMVSSWHDVKAVAAGTYCSYGLKTDGSVVAVGLNDKNQLDVSSWQGIKAISAMGKRVAGLTIMGEVKVAGNFSDGEKVAVSALTNVKQIAVGLNYIAVLKEDGSVQVIGTLPSLDLSAFQNIAKISAGTHHVLGLTADGEVVATGDNSYGQCSIDGLYDVVDVAGGEYHSAFLREDGVVEYRGLGSTKYQVDQGVGNLLYDNYVSVTKISGVTGASGGKIRIAKGQEFPIGILCEPTNATYVRMLFTSSASSVAEVVATGRDTALITAKEVGFSTLTIKDNGSGVTHTVQIEVYEDKRLEGIVFTESERSIVKGEKAYLTINFLPLDGDFSALTPYYTSSNTAVITVNPAGLIEAVGEIGQSAVITAEASGFTATIKVTIIGSVSSISVDTMGASTLYRYGEELDLSRYSLVVNTASGVERITMSPSMITGYDKNDKKSLSQTLTVTYMGITTTFSVSVRDYVVKVEKVEEPKKKYLYNYDLDEESGSFKVYMASGEVEGPNRFSRSNYSGYRKDVIGVQKVVYTYVDEVWNTVFNFEEEFTVVDYVNTISFHPLRSSYLYGEALDMHEFVDLTMMSGAIRQIQLIECSVKDEDTLESDPNSPLYALYSLRVGAHRLTIGYFDEEVQCEKTTTAIINVDIVGEFVTSGRDEEVSAYYYEVGGKLYVSVSLAQNGVADVEIKELASANDNVYFKLYTLGETETEFDSSIKEKQDALIKIFVKRQTLVGGGVEVVDVEIWSLAINAQPMEKITAVEVKDGALTKYKYGYAINSENADIVLVKTVEDGSKKEVAPMEIVYNGEIIGKQTIKIRYFDFWLELEVEIYDYMVAFEGIEEIEITWGEEVSFEVYGIFAYGGRRALNESEYVVSSYSDTQVGEQIVTITYIGDESVFTAFNLTIIDLFKSIKVKDEPRKTYAVGEAFDTRSTYTITMISGATQVVTYNATDFYYTPEFNSNMASVGIEQRITIYYRGAGVSTPTMVWSGNCYVPDFVTKLEVVGSSSKSEYKYGEELSIAVRAYYAAESNGSKILNKALYATDYNSKEVGEQTITITYNYNDKTYTATFKVVVVDTVNAIKVDKVPNRISYGFGEVISWTGAKVSVTYSAAGVKVYEGNAIKEQLNVSYSTLVSGQQKVTVECGGQSAFFNITVSKEGQSAEGTNTEKITVNVQKKEIYLSDQATVGEVADAVNASKYLTKVYTSVQYSNVDLTSGRQKSAGTGDKLIFVNAENVVVFTFSVYLKGDVNGDGKVDSSDLGGMAGMLANGTAKDEVMDYDGNGKTNLTDLVSYARKTSGQAPKQVPVSDVAKTIIATPSRLKGKENKYE